jgi:predicted glutamine amidotransferase
MSPCAGGLPIAATDLSRQGLRGAQFLISQSLRARHSHVTTNGDGFGIGWYGERLTPGVYRDILPA